MQTMRTWHFPWHWLWILLAVLALMMLIPAHARNNPPGAAQAPVLIPHVFLADYAMSRTEPKGCERPRAEQFFTGDPYAYLWLRVDGVRKGDRPVVSWIRPSGVVHRADRWDPLLTDGERCLSARIAISGDVPADEPGRWIARVEWNGMLLLENEFFVLDPSRPMITEK
ncbi:MAG: hypothetical protein R2748_23410 [Bryobacterales bacterium]